MHSLTVPASVSKRKQACKNCRQRKKRCDSERPTCGLCRRWNLRCDYVVPATFREEEDTNRLNGANTLAPNMENSLSSLVPWDPILPLQVPNLEIGSFLGRSHTDVFAPNPNSPTPVASIDPFSISGGSDVEPAFFPDTTLPTDDVLEELIEIFFEKLYFVLPCLHKTTFLEELRSRRLQGECPLLLYSVISVAAGFHYDPIVKARRNDWHEQAKILYDFTGRAPTSALRTIQAVLFLVYHTYTCGDYSTCWLYIGKAWRQAASLGMNRMDSDHAIVMPVGMKDGPHNQPRGSYAQIDWLGQTAIKREECRRTLWLLFMMDRNQSWPTGWPNAIEEKQFKLDIPVSDSVFQAMTSESDPKETKNVTFRRNINSLIASIPPAKDPLNIFHYLVIAYVLLGRTAELIHSIHDDPCSSEYAEQCEELDDSIVKLRLSIPRRAVSVLEAPVEDRGQVVWLNVILDLVSILLHYRAVPSSDPTIVEQLFRKAVMAARNTSRTIKDASHTSIDLLLNVHLAAPLYMACCVLVIHQGLGYEQDLKNEIDFLELVYERMNDVFTVLGHKFSLALKRDKARNREELLSLRERGYRGLLADCSKWSFVKDEVMKMGLTIT